MRNNNHGFPRKFFSDMNNARKRISVTFFENVSRQELALQGNPFMKIYITLGVFVIYTLLLVMLAQFAAEMSAVITPFPVVMIAWIWGCKFGILTGGLILTYNMSLYYLSGYNYYDYYNNIDYITNLTGYVTIGAVTGCMRNIRVRVKKTEEKKNKAALDDIFSNHTNDLDKIIDTVSSLIGHKDPSAKRHHERVAILAEQISRKLGVSEDTVKHVRTASLLHDLGKIVIPSDILNSTSMLNDRQMHIVKKHCAAGCDILKNVKFPWPVLDTILQHHERLDGSGYPKGLRGGEIRFEARILAVADVAEAMLSHRPYRPAFKKELVVDELNRCKGTLYDTYAVNACVSLLNDGFEF